MVTMVPRALHQAQRLRYSAQGCYQTVADRARISPVIIIGVGSAVNASGTGRGTAKPRSRYDLRIRAHANQ
jgi:hypothetical protein